MTHNLPQAIPGMKVTLVKGLTVSIGIDRALVMELGKGVVVIFSPEETSLVFDYLLRHARKFSKGGKQ